jgi:hypothetical protein
LIRVFNWRSLTFFVELFGSLRVLKSRILLGWWRRCSLRVLRSVGLGYLLGLNLGMHSEDCALRGWSRGLRRGCRGRWLGVVDGSHVGVGWIGAGVVGRCSGVYEVGIAMTTCCSSQY